MKRSTLRTLGGYFSSLGWVTLGICVVSGVAFAVGGWVEMAVIAVFCAVILLASVLLSLGNTSFETELSLSTAHVVEGDTANVTVTLSNSGSAPTTRAQAHLSLGDLEESFAVPPLKSGQSKNVTIAFTALARSVVSVGPLRVRKADPFGIVSHERTVATDTTLYVHPRTVALSAINAGILRDLEGLPSEEIVDDDLSFYGLRDYQPGDDVRNVHWLSTAKAQHLMVRQFQATRRTTTSLTFDTTPQHYRSEQEFELGVSLHACLGVQCLTEERPLTTHEATRHDAPSSPLRFLDSCARIEPDTLTMEELTSGVLRHDNEASLYIFTLGPRTGVDSVKRLVDALPPTSTVLVMEPDSQSESTLRRHDGFSVVSVHKLDDLPLLLEAWRL
jgi:hypothetical protein